MYKIQLPYLEETSNVIEFGHKVDHLPYLHGDQKWSNLVKKLIHKMDLPYLKEGSNVIKFGQKVDQQRNLPYLHCD